MTRLQWRAALGVAALAWLGRLRGAPAEQSWHAVRAGNKHVLYLCPLIAI
jgi:hypothetical protein